MEHPDLAHLAAVLAAAGAALLIAGRGRAMVLGGLVSLALGEAALLGSSSSSSGPLDRLTTPSGAVAALFGLAVLAAAAWVLLKRPGWTPVAVLVAAPLRPPISFQSGGGFPLSVATDGQLGRLLPLYFVLAAATLAFAWRALAPETRAAATRQLPRVIAAPAAAFIGFACLSLLWADSVGPSVELLTYFTVPFALMVAVVARSPFPEWAPRSMATAGIALGTLFAVIGLYQAITQKLFFYAPNLEVSNANSSLFRVTSLFGDPSLYGRHVVLALGLLLVALALQRIDMRLGIGLLVVLWLGLLFSYSQSSMVALVAVTMGVAFVTGGRAVRRAVGGGVVVAVLLAAALLASILIQGENLARETADRSQRIEDTARVVGHHPVVGVGTGNQARVARKLSGRNRPTPNFVSHFTPLTVAADLGVIGLALYVWLLIGASRAVLGVYRLDQAFGLGLATALLACVVHSLFYPGFLEDPLTWLIFAVAAGQLTWSRRDDGVHRQAAAPA